MDGLKTTTIIAAVVGGVVPTFIWLWFWLTRKDDEPEPMSLLMLAFVGGMLSVLVLFPLRPLTEGLSLSPLLLTTLYAGLEEISKVVVIALIVFGSQHVDQAIDYTVYLVTGALGFSALENTLYLLSPLNQGLDLGAIVVTGNLRFLGATVLHTVTVALVGVILGYAFTRSFGVKIIHTIVGIVMATGLHTAFNTFIMSDTRQGTIIAIAGIWFAAVIIILLFDRLKNFHREIAVVEPLPSIISPTPPNPYTL